MIYNLTEEEYIELTKKHDREIKRLEGKRAELFEMQDKVKVIQAHTEIIMGQYDSGRPEVNISYLTTDEAYQMLIDKLQAKEKENKEAIKYIKSMSVVQFLKWKNEKFAHWWKT